MMHPQLTTAAVAGEKSYQVRAWDGDAVEWNAFVAGDAGGSFCHLAGWHDVMSEVLGNEPVFLRAVDGAGNTAGVLPIVHVRSRLFGRFLMSMPFLNYGGPLGLPEARAQLTAEALVMARRSRSSLVELRTRYASEPALREEHRRITVLLPLPAASDDLWRQLPSKVRSQVRRPMKAGMVATFGADQVPAFYDVFARTMRDLGTPVLPRSFFERVASAFPEQVILAVVRNRHGKPVAAGFGFLWRGEVEITWAGALREFSTDAPNMLLYWAFMEESTGRGARTFNFGRCKAQGGTHRFKLQWGGQDAPLPWSTWSATNASAPSADSSGYGLATRAWTRLPLPVANALGPLLSRRLP